MDSTLSQGLPDFKNYLGQGRNYFQPTPKLLRNYYFTGAFTGGWFYYELLLFGESGIEPDFNGLHCFAKTWQ